MFDIMTLFIAYFSNWLQFSQIYNLENTYMCQLARSFLFFFFAQMQCVVFSVIFPFVFFELYYKYKCVYRNIFVQVQFCRVFLFLFSKWFVPSSISQYLDCVLEMEFLAMMIPFLIILHYLPKYFVRLSGPCEK